MPKIIKPSKQEISLDDFIKQAYNELDTFKEYWMKENKKNPKNFPMALPADNSGLWWEMFTSFNGE